MADGEEIGRVSSGAVVAAGFGLGFGVGTGLDPSNHSTIPLVAFARVLSLVAKGSLVAINYIDDLIARFDGVLR